MFIDQFPSLNKSTALNTNFFKDICIVITIVLHQNIWEIVIKTSSYYIFQGWKEGSLSHR